MAQNKQKTKRRIICILFASIIALYALAVPIGAVVISDEHGFKDFNLYAQSTFPLTVGFSYVTRDPSTGAGNSYVYATDIGGFGEESNKTIFGNDTYTQNYTPIEGTTYELEGTLDYNFLDTQFPDDAVIQWTDGSHTSVIKRGWREISMTNKAPSGGNISGLQQGVVLRSRDVVYNPKWLTVYDDSPSHYEDWMLPMFATPTVEPEFVNQNAIVLTYSWSCTITDGNGNIHSHSGVKKFDTRDNNSGALQEIIPIDVLLEYTNYDTIIINDYWGFIDVDYYEYTVPVDDSIVGTWTLNSSLDLDSCPSGSFLVDGTFFGLKSGTELEYFEVPLKRIFKSSDSSFADFPIQLRSYLIDDTSYPRYFNGFGYLDREGYNGYYISAGFLESSSSQLDTTLLQINSIDAEPLLTFSINSIDDSISNEYVSSMYNWLTSNAVKQGSEDDVGTWEEVSSSGDGFVFKLRYPLYNTAGVVITGTPTYKENMAKYAFPTMTKYIDTDNTYTPPLPDYNVDYTGWLGTAVGGFLDFELFPNFSLGGLLGILIGFSFVMLFLKFFAGG